MKVIDKVNRREGKGVVILGVPGGGKRWHIRQQFTSPQNMTMWSDLSIAYS
jgi:hypothetical protein